MIKLICLGAVPLLAAYVFGQRDPEPLVPAFHAVEQEDRIFLANLDVQETARREDAARAERALSEQESSSAPVPVAVAVPTPIPVRTAVAIPRAVPIPPPVPMQAIALAAPPTTRPEAIPGSAGVSGPGGVALAANGEPEVRRAIPVHASKRASIVIYHGEVFTFQPYSAYSVH